MNTERLLNETSLLIVKANDRFRETCLDVIYTSGVRDGIMNMIELSKRVEGFSRFTEDNDPYGEHDLNH